MTRGNKVLAAALGFLTATGAGMLLARPATATTTALSGCVEFASCINPTECAFNSTVSTCMFIEGVCFTNWDTAGRCEPVF